jgi:hypothetical protein
VVVVVVVYASSGSAVEGDKNMLMAAQRLAKYEVEEKELKVSCGDYVSHPRRLWAPWAERRLPGAHPHVHIHDTCVLCRRS